jgi:hypothetical protein
MSIFFFKLYIKLKPLISSLFWNLHHENIALRSKVIPINVLKIQYTPSVSIIILSGRTYSSQNVRQISDKFESQHSLSPTIWSDIVVGCESGYLKIFFTFLEVNMSNILWSMRICKRTFFPVCRMSGYVNTLVYFYLAPYSCQEG